MTKIPLKLHAIMISLPYQGHLNPFVNLALTLALRGISVTFANLECVHEKLCLTTNDPFSQARELGLDIRYTTVSDGFPKEFNRDVHFIDHLVSLCHDNKGTMDQFVAKTIESSPPHFKSFLLMDSIYRWPTNMAKKYNLINVSFWTQPALVFSIGYHWEILKEKGYIPFKDNRVVEANFLTGVIESLSTKDFMTYFSLADDTKLPEEMFKMFTNAKNADFILHNTTEELESGTLSLLNKYQPNYAIGPINFSTFTVTRSLRSESDCTRWLDSKPHGSVLYVSFGSVVPTTKQVTEEIAHGLFLSEVNFIWVLRKDFIGGGVNGSLPDGFEGQIGDKGLIIPWGNQIQILSNSAVGGFLTHNGWNSTMESMWSGVPMLCTPIAYDQPTNRKLVVDEWRVGIDLCDEGAPLDRKRVAQRIKTLMKDERLRGRVKKVKETLHNAMENNGSSVKNFDKFIKDLGTKILSSCVV